MAANKQQKVYLIPEGETRDSHTYHYTVVKTKNSFRKTRNLKSKSLILLNESMSGLLKLNYHHIAKTSFFLNNPYIKNYGRLNKFFEYLEDLILSIIAVMTIGAVGFELYAVYERGSIELADLLLMFIYAEVLGMVAIYFRSHVLPVIYPFLLVLLHLLG